jgi:hypothetical protein
MDPDRALMLGPIAGLLAGALAVVPSWLLKVVALDTSLIVGLVALGLVCAAATAALGRYVPLTQGLGMVVMVVVLLGVGGTRFVNQCLVKGAATREEIQRAAGMTTAMNTVRVPGVTVELYDEAGQKLMFRTVTDENGRYKFSNLPEHKYVMQWYLPDQPQEEIERQNQPVTPTRSMTAQADETDIVLPSVTNDMGDVFVEGPGGAGTAGPPAGGGATPGALMGPTAGPVTPVTPGDFGSGGSGVGHEMMRRARGIAGQGATRGTYPGQ